MMEKDLLISHLGDTSPLSGDLPSPAEHKTASAKETPAQAALRARVLGRIQMAPHTYADLARLVTDAAGEKDARRKLRQAVTRLEAMGLVRTTYINSRQFLTTHDWKPTDTMLARLGASNTKPGPGGCMIYQGYVHPITGPMIYGGAALKKQPKALRSLVFNDANPRNPLSKNEIAKPSCGCAGCLEESHLARQIKKSYTPGMVHTSATRAKIAAKKQSGGKLNWDIVCTIRERREPVATMAKRYGVTEATVYEVLAHKTWKEAVAA